MKYPSWAPSYLVGIHKNYLTKGDLAARGASLSSSGGLSDKEASDILFRMLTDRRMEKVWASLGRRFESKRPDYQYYRFVTECLFAAGGWRRSPKLTVQKRRILVDKLKNNIANLSKLLIKFGYLGNPLFEHIRTDKPTDKELSYFLEQIEWYSNDDVAQTQIPVALPSMQWFLRALSADIDDLAAERLLVTKPKSKNAPLHYFIRNLNNYFMRRCGQPLHGAVAIISSVVLKLDDVDPDLVRKLTRV